MASEFYPATGSYFKAQQINHHKQKKKQFENNFFYIGLQQETAQNMTPSLTATTSVVLAAVF